MSANMWASRRAVMLAYQCDFRQAVMCAWRSVGGAVMVVVHWAPCHARLVGQALCGCGLGLEFLGRAALQRCTCTCRYVVDIAGACAPGKVKPPGPKKGQTFFFTGLQPSR